MAEDTSFVPDLAAWDPWRPDEVARALGCFPALWAVAGGWAIDLFLGRVTRPHEDIEIAIARSDMRALRTRLSELEWFAVGDGRAWPISDAPLHLFQTWGRDDSGRWRLDVFHEPWAAGDWVCRRDPRIRRPLGDVIEHSPDGIPYLAPEIVLVFKAKARRDKDEADLALTLPFLTQGRISWFRQALRVIHPEHDWLPRLTNTV